MLFTRAQSLKEHLIELLALRPHMTAEALRAELALRSSPFSRRAVFKELKALEQLGVILKTGSTYALQLMWIINMTTLFRGAYLSYLDGVNNTNSITLNKRVKLTYYDLARLDHAWMQIFVILQQMYPNDYMRIWKPEQWFHLIHERTTDNFFSALSQVGGKQRHIIGHDCYLCRYGARQIPSSLAQVRFIPDPFSLGITTYLTMIGEHLITIRLNSAFAESMRCLFASVTKKEEMLRPALLEFMRGRVESTLVVEYRPKGLRELIARFDRVFVAR
jgi:hypothetical protein